MPKPPEEAKYMEHKNFFGLVRWQIEEYLNLPILAFLIASAIIAVLSQTSTNILPDDYVNLYYGSGAVFTILALVASALFSRSFAGSMARGEMKLMLSYPIKRWQLFISKFTALFLTIFVIYGAVYSLHFYLDMLNLFEPMFYLSLFAFFLQLMVACAVSVAVSMVSKNEAISILASVLLLLGLDNMSGTSSYFSGQGRFQFLFQYFGKLTHDSLPFGDKFIVTTYDVVMAVSVPALIFAVLLFAAFVYFIRILEVD
jgi:ABC-type transport system involved in multi-copper enzyme maturation permease subunit